MDLQPGQEIKNYRLLKKLGDGASGEVWQARDLNSPRDVAIKLMHLHLVSGTKSIHRDRFEREVKAVEVLGEHPNIPNLYDVDLDYERPFFVMQYIRGEGVDNLVYEIGIDHIAMQNRIDIICQIGDALAFAHAKGYVHRDIKPSNVKIIGNDTAYLLDFSVAFGEEDSSKTQLGIGTPLYMPPEIFPSRYGDIFSLGLVAFEIIYARHPIFLPDDIITSGAEAKSLMDERLNTVSWTLPSQLPPIPDLTVDYERLDRTFQTVFAHSPSQRYRDANAFCDDLRSAVGLSEIQHVAVEETPFAIKRGRDTKQITGIVDISEIDAQAAQLKNTVILPSEAGRSRLWMGAAALIIIGLVAVILFLLNQNSDNTISGTPTEVAIVTETALPTEEVIAPVETAEAVETELATTEPTDIVEATDIPTAVIEETEVATVEATQAPTSTHTPTATRRPTATITPTPEPELTDNLRENLEALFARASNIDVYPCLLHVQVYEHIAENQNDLGSEYARYGEQLVGSESPMTAIYNFCKNNAENEMELTPQLETTHDEFLELLRNTIPSLQ